ncbi:uncharacterized protein LOC125815057 [Solanum verrucosum]|uniref:uncharacterized protein LOC125815057 n=1 Tax=Solanum verrucosum TaxID=315347 RepID=UPI0020D095EB|nr:uncharacterized protein LOC125815057 [Solanum verrucosum]
MDFSDGLPKSHSSEVIPIVVDRLNKYGHFLPLKHPYTAQSVAQVFLDTIVKLHGLPDTITNDRNAIQNTPYEALYGRPPPLHLPYLSGESASSEVDTTLVNKELKLQLLKHHLHKAQLRMKQQIIKKVGPVAYTLLLPNSVKIHKTVHVLLKKCYEMSSHISYPLIVGLANLNFPTPESVLQRIMVKKGNKVVAQVLVKWVGLPADVTTWESATILKTRFPSFDP